MAFFNLSAFSILRKKLLQNLQQSYIIHCKIRGVLIFPAFLCLSHNLERKNITK